MTHSRHTEGDELDADGHSPSKVRRVLTLSALGLVVGGMILSWLWERGAEKRALMNLSPQERRPVYTRELENLHVLCGDGPGKEAMAERCRTQAEFLLDFPECDAACQAFVQEQRPHATK
jgi:cytochrome b pre-mRNA-processing protein 3